MSSNLATWAKTWVIFDGTAVRNANFCQGATIVVVIGAKKLTSKLEPLVFKGAAVIGHGNGIHQLSDRHAVGDLEGCQQRPARSGCRLFRTLHENLDSFSGVKFLPVR